MHPDIIDLRTFYRSQLGQRSQRSVAACLTPLWTRLPDERLMGLGYCRPYLDSFAPDAERAMAFMPAQQGAAQWPASQPSATALVFDEELPLPDASLDRILCVHAFEHAENPANLLAEAWRVLAPNGRLIIVVPNRRGMWARFDHTPFGRGRPYSRGQLNSGLREAGFTVEGWSDALHFPPFERKFALSMAGTLERAGRKFWPVFAGVIAVESSKKLYQGLVATNRASRRVLVPALEPQGVGARLGADRQSCSG